MRDIEKEIRLIFLSFMYDVFLIESSSSYLNAFSVADMPYNDSYVKLKTEDVLFRGKRLILPRLG